jgi:hypothetical protein
MVRDIFPELEPLLNPFRSALKKRDYEQLEGQVKNVKIFISRVSTQKKQLGHFQGMNLI